MVDLSRAFEFLSGKRKMVPINEFAVPGVSGPLRLRESLNLDFVPNVQRVEVVVENMDHQTYHRVVLDSLKV